MIAEKIFGLFMGSSMMAGLFLFVARIIIEHIRTSFPYRRFQGNIWPERINGFQYETCSNFFNWGNRIVLKTYIAFNNQNQSGEISTGKLIIGQSELIKIVEEQVKIPVEKVYISYLGHRRHDDNSRHNHAIYFLPKKQFRNMIPTVI